jgi:hypothetical protein
MAAQEKNGNGRLEDSLNALVQAQALLVQSQALMVQNQANYLAQKAETDKWVAQIEKESAQYRKEIGDWQRLATDRFARIEAILIEHGQILKEHNRILQALPDLIGERIGFKVPNTPAPPE